MERYIYIYIKAKRMNCKCATSILFRSSLVSKITIISLFSVYLSKWRSIQRGFLSSCLLHHARVVFLYSVREIGFRSLWNFFFRYYLINKSEFRNIYIFRNILIQKLSNSSLFVEYQLKNLIYTSVLFIECYRNI